MGTPVLEPSGHFLNAYLSGIEQRTYVVPPVYLVTAAGWFRVFGFGLVQMRSYSILWGLVLIVTLTLLTWKLCGRWEIALGSLLLNSCDFIVLWRAAEGRMDTMCVALGFAGQLAYLALRQRSLTLAVAVSQSLIALAMFTHPNAFMAELCLIFLAVRFDRTRLNWKLLPISAMPFAVGLLGWLPYILEAPRDFVAQFSANAAGRSGLRWKGIINPALGIGREFVIRYFSQFGKYSPSTGPMPLVTMLVPFYYFGIVWGCFRSRAIREDFGKRTLTLLTLAQMGMMTFLLGFKAPMYLICVVPLYNCLIALWFSEKWKRDDSVRALAALVVASYAAINIGTIAVKINEDPVERDYRPTIRLLKEYARQGRSIVGSAALGFDLDYARFRDDARFGRFTGFRPEVIVLDTSYQALLQAYIEDEPAVLVHSLNLLRDHYRLAYRNPSYEVHVRQPDIEKTKVILAPNR